MTACFIGFSLKAGLVGDVRQTLCDQLRSLSHLLIGAQVGMIAGDYAGPEGLVRVRVGDASNSLSSGNVPCKRGTLWVFQQVRAT